MEQMGSMLNIQDYDRIRVTTSGGRFKTRKSLKVSTQQAAEEVLNSRKLTDRDLKVLETLLCVGVLSRHQIQRLFWPTSVNTATTSMRLNLLYERWLITDTPRVIPTMSEAGLVPCHVYTLGPVGEEVLALQEGLNRKQIALGRRYSLGRGAQLIMHDLQVSEVFVQATSIVRQRADLEMKWANEKLASIWNKDNEIVRPDGAMLLKQDERITAHFIEMDRGATRWEEKVEAYEKAQEIGEWMGRWRLWTFPPVLSIVPAGRSKQIAKIVAEKRRKVVHLLKEWPDVLRSDVLEGWLDVGSGQSVSLPLTPQQA